MTRHHGTQRASQDRRITAEAVGRLSTLAPVPSTEAFAGLIDGSSAGRGWRGVGVWDQTIMPMRSLLLPPLTTHHVVILLEGEGTVTQHRPRGRHEGRWAPGDFAYLPAGTACGWRFEGGMRLVHVDFTADFFRRVCLDVCNLDPFRLAFRPSFHGQDGDVLTLTRWLVRELTADAIDGPVYAEAVGALLAIHVLRAFVEDPKRLLANVGGLQKHRLRRVLAYINDNLDAPLSLEQMARECSYSPFHFARAFKASMGLPPHRYQSRLRLERAKVLLLETELPVTEVAGSVGYDPNQLARAFRKELGCSPSQYRRDRRA